MLKRKWVLFLLMSTLICSVQTVHAAEMTTVAAGSSIEAAGSGTEQADTYEDNLTITIKYENVELKNLDIYRIACYKDGKDRMQYIDIDASQKEIIGYLEPGDYEVRSIYYLGSNDKLKELPVATSTTISAYTDKQSTVFFNIGSESVKAFEKRFGTGYVFQQTAPSEYDSRTSAENAFQSAVGVGEMQTPFVDEDTFGVDEAAIKKYRERLIEKGLMNPDGSLTELGQQLQDAIDDGLIADEMTATTKEQKEALQDQDNKAVDSDEMEDSGSQTARTDSSDVKETRYDEEETGEETHTAPAWLQAIFRFLPYIMLAGGAILIYLYSKKNER